MAYNGTINFNISIDSSGVQEIRKLNDILRDLAGTAKTTSNEADTAWTSMQTSMIHNINEVINSIDKGFSKSINSMEKLIVSTGSTVNKELKGMAKAFDFATNTLDPLLGVIANAHSAFEAFEAVIGIVTLLKQKYGAIILANTLLKLKDIAATGAATIAGIAYTKVIMNQTAQKIISTTAKKAGLIVDADGLLLTKAGIVATTLQTAKILLLSGALMAKNAIVGRVTGNMKLAAAAQLLWNAAIAVSPIGLLIAAVVALVAIGCALVKFLRSGSDEAKAQNKEIKELTKAHKEYENQLADDKAAAENAIAMSKAQATANSDLVDSLRQLIIENYKCGTKNEEIASTVDKLNNSVEGLGLSYDENSRSLSENINQLSAYIRAQDQLVVIRAQEDEYNRLLSEEQSILAKINYEKARQAELEKLKDAGIISGKEYNKLLKESNKLLDGYTETHTRLGIEAKIAGNIICNEAKKKAIAETNAHEAINRARDKNGKNLKQLAKLHNLTTDEILNDMERQELSLEEWSDKMAEGFTKNGQSLEGVANQWGMTSVEVKAYMDEWGMNLDEFVADMEKSHTKEGLNLEQLAERWGMTAQQVETEMDNMGLSMQQWSDNQQAAWQDYQNAISAHTGNIINSFKEIPEEYEMSADDMINILAINRQRYAEWKEAMTEISGQVSAETLAELEKLGPGALSAINAMRENGGKKLAQFNDEINAAVEESTKYVIQEYNDPAFINAPANGFDTQGDKIAQNDSVQNAVNCLANDVDLIISELPPMAETHTTQMVTDMDDALISGIPTLNSSADEVSHGIVDSLIPMISGAITVTNRMMDGIREAMNRKAWELFKKAAEIANTIAKTMASALDVRSPSRVMINLFEFVMLGIWEGMDGMSGMLYRKADEISDGIAKHLAVTPDVFDCLYKELKSVSGANIAFGSALLPQAALAGADGGVTYVTNLTQNITTPKPLSPSEMTREGQDMMRRAKWKLP